MNFSFPPEYHDYRDRLTEFVREEITPYAREYEVKATFPRELWTKCAEFGVQGLAAPRAYGGELEEVDFPRALLAMEGFGYACNDNGLPFALNAQMWTVQMPILHFGSEEQKEKYLRPMVSGKMIGAHALTEPNAGSDVMSMQLSAAKNEAGNYVLNGKKRLITLGPAADVVLVFANARPEMGKWGVSAFLVERGTPGFTQTPRMGKLGMRSVPIGELIFENCEIPANAILGSEGSGFAIVNHSLEYDRCSILASQLGAMKRQLEQSLEFAKKREQFGRPIGQFQSVSNRLVDMKLRLETARLLLYKTAWLKQQGKPALMEAALLKLHLSESFVASSLDAMRTFGGGSYLTDEDGPERDLRDALGGILYAGTSDIQRNIVAKLMGL
ncbi:acyl-CoA dehydrogenase [Lewinellaceae bacterium SD302]|nr:acyl-CoA dehydrogenase [Lewinellaceae bacterium SD302]